MVLTQSKAFNQLQRIQVETGRDSEGQRVTIRVESYDERLGWYTAGSLALPLCQLPLLEQALEEMRRCNQSDEEAKIIPFPTGEAAIRNCVG